MSLLIRPRAHQWWCCAVQFYSVGTADTSPIWAVRTSTFCLNFSFCFLFAIHGQLISSSSTFCLSATLASIRSVLTSVFSAYTAHPRRRWLDHSCTLALVFQASTKMTHFLFSPHHKEGRRIELWGLRRAWPFTFSALVRHIHSKHKGRHSTAFPHIWHLTSLLLIVFVLCCW